MAHGSPQPEIRAIRTERTVEWLTHGPDAFVAADGSVLLGITSAELVAATDWHE